MLSFGVFFFLGVRVNFVRLQTLLWENSFLLNFKLGWQKQTRKNENPSLESPPLSCNTNFVSWSPSFLLREAFLDPPFITGQVRCFMFSHKFFCIALMTMLISCFYIYLLKWISSSLNCRLHEYKDPAHLSTHSTQFRAYLIVLIH